MKYTKKELRDEARLIKNYLKCNSYISDIFKNTSYSLTQYQCQDLTIPQIMKLLENELFLSNSN